MGVYAYTYDVYCISLFHVVTLLNWIPGKIFRTYAVQAAY